MNKKYFGALLAVSSLSLSSLAFGASPNPATTTFNVSITLASSCTVTAGSDIDLGTQDQSSTDTTGSSTFNVTCTKSTPYTVSMTPSNNDTGGAGTMAATIGGNSDTVAYNLYQDAAGATAWGDVSGTNTLAGTGNGAAQSLTVYAQVLAAEYTKQPDTYTDTVTIAVNY